MANVGSFDSKRLEAIQTMLDGYAQKFLGGDLAKLEEEISAVQLWVEQEHDLSLSESELRMLAQQVEAQRRRGVAGHAQYVGTQVAGANRVKTGGGATGFSSTIQFRDLWPPAPIREEAEIDTAHASPRIATAEIPVEEYKLTSERDLDCLRDSEVVAEILASLPRGARVMDAGGGYSMYGVQLATDLAKQARVTTVSLHDFYGQIFAIRSPQQLLQMYESGRYRLATGALALDMIGDSNLKTLVVKDLQKVFDIPTPQILEDCGWGLRPTFAQPECTDEEVAGALFDVIDEIKTRIRHLDDGGLFVRQIGTLDAALRDVQPGSVDLYLDIVGAYTYSSDRFSQLQAAIDRLSPSGKAVIWLDGDEPDVVVSERDGEPTKEPLFEFLDRSFEDAFVRDEFVLRWTNATVRSPILVIDKSKLPPDFRLDQVLTQVKCYDTEYRPFFSITYEARTEGSAEAIAEQ